MNGSYNLNLKYLTEIPDKLLNIEREEIYDLFPEPTLIHLKGNKPEALFLSTMLHGNEFTSFIVLKKLLNEYSKKNLPRDLIIFIGNTIATSQGVRHLEDQIDYNRIWEVGDTPEHKIADQVISYAKEQQIFASIDIHNNTGINPLYGCINSLEKDFLSLASYFGDNTVYFTEPHNVQSMAFSKFCTSITIEAGLPGSSEGVEASYNFVKEILEIDKLVENKSRSVTEVYHTIGRIMIDSDSTVDFDNSKSSPSDFSLVPTIDTKNFQLIKKFSKLGFAKSLSKIKIEDNNGNDISNDFLILKDNELLTNRIFIPSMFTKDIYVMKEDCLGYIMEIMIPMN